MSCLSPGAHIVIDEEDAALIITKIIINIPRIIPTSNSSNDGHRQDSV